MPSSPGSSVRRSDCAKRRAQVSKRELYRLFDGRQAIIEACVARRTADMRLPINDVQPSTRGAFVAGLVRFGSAILRELSDPTVVALYRLAVSQTDASPQIAGALDTSGREVTRQALIGLLARGQAIGGLGAGEPATMAGEFFRLLWGDLRVRLILGVAPRPGARECDRRAHAAVDALLRLHPAD